jgi:hypothetical protein
VVRDVQRVLLVGAADVVTISATTDSDHSVNGGHGVQPVQDMHHRAVVLRLGA